MIAQGIEMPVLSDRWRFVLYTFATDGFNNDISTVLNSVERCSVDYVNSIITVEIRQGVTGWLHEIMYQLCREENFNCRIDALSGAANIEHSTGFAFCKVMDHKCAYDYANHDTLKHVLKIKFSEMTLMAPEAK